MKRTLRGQAAIVGVGETTYYRWGKSPDDEFALALQAILAACADAGVDPRTVDGISSYSDDRNTAIRLAAALGLPDLKLATMVWGGGGGGGSAALANASMAVATGVADCVVVFRGLAQGQFKRFGRGAEVPSVAGDPALVHPYGVMSAAQSFAMRFQRFVHEHGAGMAAQRAVSLASYHHAQNNPRAVMNGRPLDGDTYDESRWIVEPWRLYDCCQENDGAAAMLVMSAERAADTPHPVYVLGAAQGTSQRFIAGAHNGLAYGGSGFTTVAPRLWDMAEVTPADVDVVQSYENFTGGVVMSLVEHGLCSADEVDEVLTVDNLIAPTGSIPLNTSGGNLAECYMHGLGLLIEGARQLRGESVNQVPDARVALVTSGPMVAPVSSSVLGTKETL